MLGISLLVTAVAWTPPLTGDEAKATSEAAVALAALNAEFESSTIKGRSQRADAFRGRYRALADEYVGTDEGLEALMWLTNNCWWLRSEGASVMHQASREFVDEILEDYEDHKGIDKLVDYAYVMSTPNRVDLYTKLRESENANVRASGTLGFARLYERSEPEKSKGMYNELIEKYADVTSNFSTYGEIANAVLNKHNPEDLKIGKKAPDIVGRDADGSPMRLSDYEGKVILLDFWGDW